MSDGPLKFKPKLLTVLREGYGRQQLQRDVVAGVTVGVVALPLSMAISIACGLPPETGLLTAIIGGFIVSAMGGSRFQIGGPAGAFIVPIATTLAVHGIQGLILATFLSGALLVLAGALKLGRFVRLIPKAVVLGFTVGIAVIIAFSQLHDLLGLNLTAKEPVQFIPKLMVLFLARSTVNSQAIGVSIFTIVVVLALRRQFPRIPGMLVAIVGATILASVFDLNVETLGERFGALSSKFPAPALPVLSDASLIAIFRSALSFALLGAIESLLSATVADTMTNRQHRPEAELVAQGFANMGSALFGGFCVTGTIARTATNIKAGAHGPIAGIFHAVFVLIAYLVLMPAASHIPFAALSGVLIVVAFNMVERHEITAIAHTPIVNKVAFFVTMALVITVDLTVGIALGCALLGASRLYSGVTAK